MAINPTSVLAYVAWHLGVRQPEPRRSVARITYAGSEREQGATPAPPADETARVDQARAPAAR